MEKIDVCFSKIVSSKKNIVCLGGSPLPVLGVAHLLFSRQDLNSLVTIPCMPVEVLVLPELSVVDANVLIGSDFVSVCGGLHLDYDNSDGTLARVVFGRAASPNAATSVTKCAPTTNSVWHVDDKLSWYVTLRHDRDMWCCRLMTAK